MKSYSKLHHWYCCACIGTAWFSAAGSMRAESQEVKKPNIILILADDMGYGDISRKDPKAKIQTPSIDTLASEGMSFSDAHSTAAICTPTRYSLLTGRYYWRNKTYQKIGWRVVRPWLKPLIEEGRLTLPEMLRKSGYHTACIGKWHLGFDWQVKKGGKMGNDYKDLDYSKKIGGGPITRGFDYFFGVDSPNHTYTFIENDRHVEVPTQKPYHPYAAARTRKTAKGWTFEKLLSTLTNQSLRYIEARSHKSGPFFLYLPLTAPHTPIAPSKSFVGKSKAGAYGDFVCEVDWVVGQIMDSLKRHNLDKNTIVIFSSDNGSPERDGKDKVGGLKSIARYNHHPNGKFRGMKADLWEGGHRVPFIVKWPGVTRPGSHSSQLVCQVDLMRTFADALGVDLPTDAAEDSYNIGPIFAGKDEVVRSNLVTFDEKIPAIRLGRWKLILHKGASGFSKHAGYTAPANAPAAQLYDMEDDPYERVNLYRKMPEVAKRLNAYLDQVIQSGRSAISTISALSAIRLECEMDPEPLRLQKSNPKLSWDVKGASKLDRNPVAYRVLVASSRKNLDAEKGDMWDTDRISSKLSSVTYKGRSLRQGKDYYWKVKLWSNDKLPSVWSKSSHWRMGAKRSPSKKSDAKDQPRVLIIGDSTSMRYAPILKKIYPEARIHRPAGNHQGTALALKNMNRWIGDTDWDVIHFNFGLHDFKHIDPKTGKASNNANHPFQTPPEQYRKNLETIIKRFKKTGAILIFATTTPVPSDEHYRVIDHRMSPVYNKIAIDVMRQHGVVINDIYNYTLPHVKEWQQPKDVHFNATGSRKIAKKIKQSIDGELQKKH